MLRPRGIALAMGTGCVAAALVVSVLASRADQQRSQTLDTQLRATAGQGVTVAEEAFERDRTISLALSHDTALNTFAQDRRPLAVKMADRKGAIVGVQAVLASLDLLLPGAVTNAGFALGQGAVVASYSQGAFLPSGQLANVGGTTFFRGALLAGSNTVYRSDIATDSAGQEVITYATEVTDWGVPEGVVYFSVSLSSLRNLLQPLSSGGIRQHAGRLRDRHGRRPQGRLAQPHVACRYEWDRHPDREAPGLRGARQLGVPA